MSLAIEQGSPRFVTQTFSIDVDMTSSSRGLMVCSKSLSFKRSLAPRMEGSPHWPLQASQRSSREIGFQPRYLFNEIMYSRRLNCLNATFLFDRDIPGRNWQWQLCRGGLGGPASVSCGVIPGELAEALRGGPVEGSKLMAKMRLVTKAAQVDHHLVCQPQGYVFAGPSTSQLPEPHNWSLVKLSNEESFKLPERNQAQLCHCRRLETGLNCQLFPVLYF